MEKKDWSKTSERFIAYFDIMGFKVMMKSDKLEDISKKFSDLIKANTYHNRRSRIDYYIYSDLIVVLTQDGTQDSLKQLLEASVKITNEIMDLNWGMSGSIAKGKVFYDRDKHIILGQPVVDAYLMQEDVEFYGIAVCDSAVEDVKKYIENAKTKKISEHLSGLLKEERIYFKSGHYSQYHLRWFDYKYNSVGPQHPYYIKKRDNKEIQSKLETMMSETKGRSKRYIENTLDILGK